MLKNVLPQQPPITSIRHNLTLEEWRAAAVGMWRLMDNLEASITHYNPEWTRFVIAVHDTALKRHEYLQTDGRILGKKEENNG